VVATSTAQGYLVLLSEDSTVETEAAILDVARRTIRKMFECCEHRPMDDAEFVPLVGCVVEAVADHAGEAGRGSGEVARLRGAVEQFAVDIYVRLCQGNDPQNADADEDAQTFAHLMKHGRWPQQP